MKIDLFKTYKKFYQRSYRDPRNLRKVEITDAVFNLIKKIPNAATFISEAERIAQLEKDSGVRVLFSDELLTAAKTGNFKINVPAEISHSWDNFDVYGLVYIFTAPSRPGQCKLGATTMSIYDREVAYFKRYGYFVFEYFSITVRRPFELEQMVAKEIKSARISGRTCGESNEWYEMSAEAMKEAIFRLKKNRQDSLKR
jgi:hypothetical protein